MKKATLFFIIAGIVLSHSQSAFGMYEARRSRIKKTRERRTEMEEKLTKMSEKELIHYATRRIASPLFLVKTDKFERERNLFFSDDLKPIAKPILSIIARKIIEWAEAGWSYKQIEYQLLNERDNDKKVITEIHRRKHCKGYLEFSALKYDDLFKNNLEILINILYKQAYYELREVANRLEYAKEKLPYEEPPLEETPLPQYLQDHLAEREAETRVEAPLESRGFVTKNKACCCLVGTLACAAGCLYKRYAPESFQRNVNRTTKCLQPALNFFLRRLQSKERPEEIVEEVSTKVRKDD